jgi:hypothetical protein
MTAIHIVYADKYIALRHVSMFAHVGHAIFWYQASRA